MFFICQNLKHVHIIFSFLELLIFFWLTLIHIHCLGFISHHLNEILYVNTNSERNQSWYINKETYIFTCLWYWCWKNKQLKIPYQQFLILRRNHLQMFFKIGAHKNFLMLWIKKRFQHSFFPVNIAKFLKTAFL